MFLQFSIADQEGQFLPPFAIGVKRVSWHGLSRETMLVDINHTDGTAERLKIAPGSAFADFRVGTCGERIVGIQVLEFAHPVLTKDEFHSRVGKGMFVHPLRGHFVDESELPPDQATEVNS